MEESKELYVTEELRNENEEAQNGCEDEVPNNETGLDENGKIQNGSGDNGEHEPLKIKSKIGDYHINALPFVPKRGNSSPKDEIISDRTKDDQSVSPILTVPNGLTIKCNPRILQSISARGTESDSNNIAQLKSKSLFTLSAAETKVNKPPAIRACSTPQLPRISASALF